MADQEAESAANAKADREIAASIAADNDEKKRIAEAKTKAESLLGGE